MLVHTAGSDECLIVDSAVSWPGVSYPATFSSACVVGRRASGTHGVVRGDPRKMQVAVDRGPSSAGRAVLVLLHMYPYP